MKKAIALITSMSFLVGIAVPGHAALQALAPEGSAFSVPAAYGKVTGGKYYGKGDVIINIQDLHCHGEVQRNTAKIIEYFDDKYTLSHVYLEGASGDLNTDLISDMRKSDIGAATIENMIDSGYLNGTEYYSAVKGKKNFIKGVENKDIYDKNILLLNKIIESEQDVRAICDELAKELGPVKKEYGSFELRKLDRLVKRFEKKKMKADRFYALLLEYAAENGINTDKYHNIKGYVEFSGGFGNLNHEKVTKEFKQYINILKEKISYKDFARLSDKSNSFADIEEIALELIALSEEYDIIRERKLYALKTFFDYLEFNNKVNPMVFADEEKELEEALYGKLGRNKYEQEVIFLSEFIPQIKGYFTASITADELNNFEDDFKRFRKSWCSYFSHNNVKKLDKYAQMLQEYHGNNIKRDEIFAGILLGPKAGSGISLSEMSGVAAFKKIGETANAGNVKIVVTGGFHSKGLEKIFEDNKVSYVIVTPKITKNTEAALDVYKNTIKAYRKMAESTINVKPFMQEAVNESLPKLAASCFDVLSANNEYSRDEKIAGTYEFIKDFLSKHKTGGVELESWNIDSYTQKEMRFSAVYRDKKTKEILGEKKYYVSDGKLFEVEGGKPSEKSFSYKPLSVFNAFIEKAFNGTKSAGYKFVTVYAVPVLEEFVFRYLPFAAVAALTVNPFSAISLLLTAVAGVGIFTFAHYGADKAAVKIGLSGKMRNPLAVAVPAFILTGTYAALSFAFPAVAWFAFAAVTGLHMLINYLSLKGVIKTSPLSIFDGVFKISGNAENELSKRLPEFIDSIEDNFKNQESFFYKYLDEDKKKKFDEYLNKLRATDKKGARNAYNELSGVLNSLYDFVMDDIGYFNSRRLVMAMLDSFKSIGFYARRDDGKTIFEESFKFLSDTYADGQVDDIKGMLILYAAEAYKIDKSAGAEMLKKLTEKKSVFRAGRLLTSSIITMPVSITSLAQARRSLPKGWENIIQESEFEEFYEMLGIPFLVDGYDSKFYTQISYTPAYAEILKKLPADIAKAAGISEQEPVVMKIRKGSAASSAKSKELSRKFDVFSEILENNIMALAELSDTSDNGLKNALVYLEKMVGGLKEITPSGKAAETALNEIKQILANRLTAKEIEEQRTLKEWTAGEIYKIRELYTLLNAVHQTSIAVFMRMTRDHDDGTRSVEGLENVRRIIVNPDEEPVTFYDFSEKEMDDATAEFLSGMEAIKYKIRLVGKNGKFIWSKSPGEHSIDLFVDLNDINEGIRFSYNDSVYGGMDGKKDDLIMSRIRGMEKDFKELGMSVKVTKEGGVVRFYAVYGAKDKASAPAEYARVLKHIFNTNRVLALLMLGNEIIHERAYDAKYSPAFGEQGAMKAMYDYLGVAEGFRNENQIVRMFVDGKIAVNPESGILERKAGYEPAQKIAAAVAGDRDASFAQAQLLNIINYDDMGLVSEGYIGSMIAVSGMIKVKNGYISIKGAVDRERRRLKCAHTELVTLDGVRKELRYDELIGLLRGEGHAVKRQEARTRAEKERSLERLAKKIDTHKDSAEIKGMGVSAGIGGYVSGIVAYDGEKLTKDSIWIVGYTSPEDIEKIETVKGLITTSGGVLSHANITARENGKSAVLLSGKWREKGLEEIYYTPSGEKNTINGFETQNLQENRILLKKGQRILINGQTGDILVFNDISKKLSDKLQKAIDSGDSAAIRKAIEKHQNKDNIGQILEFIYFQTVGKEDKAGIFEILSDIGGANKASDKIKQLNEIYVSETLDRLETVLKNAASSEDANVAINLLTGIRNESAMLETAGVHKQRVEAFRDSFESAVFLKNEEFKKFISAFKDKASELAGKETLLTESEAEEAVKLMSIAAVWRNFNGYDGIAAIVNELGEKIEKMQKTKSRDTSIAGFENIFSYYKSRFGSKTSELAAIFKFAQKNNYEDIGVYVPYGIGIGSDIFEYFFTESAEAGLYKELMKTFENAVKEGDEKKAQKAAKKITDLIKRSDNARLTDKIEKMLDENKKYAVRSSGVGEDGAMLAFAGMGDTFLNANTGDVYEGLKKCWESFFSRRSVEYMSHNKQFVKPAVLIEEMVEDVAKAGAVFTQDSSGNLTIEVVRGLGEGLVSGRIEPDHIEVNTADNSIEYLRALNNVKKIVPLEGGGTMADVLRAEEKIERIIDEKTVRKLYEIAKELEKDAGYPVDIEFAIDGSGKIFILQRRAVTTLLRESVKKIDIDFSIVAELLDSLKSLRKSDAVQSAIDAVSSITEDTPAEETYSVLSEQLSGLLSGVAGIGDLITQAVARASLFVRNVKTGQPLFGDIVNMLIAQKEEYDKRKEKGTLDSANYGSLTGNLRTYMFNIFKMTYAVNPGVSLKLIKAAYEKDLIDNKTVGYALRDTIVSYEEFKNYFSVMSDYGVDKDIYKELAANLEKLSAVKITDEQTAADIAASAEEIRKLEEVINPSMVPVLEYQLRLLIARSGDLRQKGENKAAEEILNAVLSILSKTVEKSGSIDEKTVAALQEALVKAEYGSADFKALTGFFVLAISNADNNTVRSKDHLTAGFYGAAKSIFFSASKFDIESGEYKTAKAAVLAILNGLALANVASRDASVGIIEILGFNAESVGILSKALKEHSGQYYYDKVSIPWEDKNISEPAETAKILVESIDSMNVARAAFDLFEAGENGEKTAFAIINILSETVENFTLDNGLRRKYASVLGEIVSRLYGRVNDSGKINIKKLNEMFASLGMDCELIEQNPFIKYYSEEEKTGRIRKSVFDKYGFDDREGNVIMFGYSPFIQKLPENVLPAKRINFKSPVFSEIRGNTNRDNKRVRDMSEEFENLQDVLKYNVLALEASDNIEADSTKLEWDRLFQNVAAMINSLEKINAGHAAAAKTALNNIRQSVAASALTWNFMEEQRAFGKWDVSSIDKITGINTLVNAVHQTSINDFRSKITSLSIINKEELRTLTAMHEGNKVMAYDLSNKPYMNKDIRKFVCKLAAGGMSVNDFIFKDDIVVWTNMLNIHSVDIFLNFGDSDRGISIDFHESDKKDGNVQRVKYFEEILIKFGFDVKIDINVNGPASVCSLKAVLNKDSGLNDYTDLVETAYWVTMLFKYSVMLDWDLEKMKDKNSPASYQEAFARLVEKFMAGDIGYGYNPDSRKAYDDNKITSRSPHPNYRDTSRLLNKILGHLKLDLMPDGFRIHYLDQGAVEKYFNKPIERAFAEGRIILNDNGELAVNENFGMIVPFIGSIKGNEDEMFAQGRTLNLAGRAKFDYKVYGFAGDFMFVSGMYKTADGILFVKGLMNPLTGRLKYALCEFVDASGRKPLSNGDLVMMLNDDGFRISYEEEVIGAREKERITASMRSGLQKTESPEILCDGTSDAGGIYVAGNLTFDRTKIGPENIFVAPYTTPDDIEIIRISKAVITTGGGYLSHAAITTREFGKPSVIAKNALLNDNGLDTEYYIQSGPIVSEDGIQIKEVTAKEISLSEGARVLLNGETGKVLLFNDIDLPLIDELQGYINANDAEGVKKFLNAHAGAKEINRLIEYAFFQAVSNNALDNIKFSLLGNDMPKSIKMKIAELNEGYVRHTARIAAETVKTLSSVENPATAYAIVTKLISKIGQRDDMSALRNELRALQKNIKAKALNHGRDLKKDGKVLAGKNELSPSEARQVIKILSLMSVFKKSIPQISDDAELSALRNDIDALSKELGVMLSEFQRSKKYEIGSEITTLDDIYEEDIQKFGSKTVNLASMRRLTKSMKDVEVPQGVALSSNVMEMYFSSVNKRASFRALNSAFEDAVKQKNYESARDIAKSIQDLIDEKSETTNGLKKIISAVLKFLKKDVSYSVRTSGVGEDNEDRAYAGIGETLPGVSYDKVFDAVKECWKSFYSERSIQYMIDSGTVVKPAVLIQEMADENIEKSGVAFSRNKYGNTVIETLYGFGDGVVSGMFTPDRIEVDPVSGEIIEYSVADKQFKRVVLDGWVDTQNVAEGRHSRVLDHAMVKRLNDITSVLEKDAGYPVDIEFAVNKAGKIFLMQRRAITTLESSYAQNGNAQKETKRDVAVISASFLPAGAAAVMNIAHPYDADEAIPVYFERNSGNLTVLAVDAKYVGLLENSILFSLISDRINSDPVVLAKFNSFIPVTARVRAGEINMLPVYVDMRLYDPVGESKSVLTLSIDKMLSAA